MLDGESINEGLRSEHKALLMVLAKLWTNYYRSLEDLADILSPRRWGFSK